MSDTSTRVRDMRVGSVGGGDLEYTDLFTLDAAGITSPPGRDARHIEGAGLSKKGES